jgi:ACDE family multidrug resistance protein
MNHKNLSVIFLTTLMAVLGVASITPAFPSIIKHFGISPTQVTLLITVFTLPGIFLAPVVGILADRFGRKIILFPSLILFGIAGSACSLVDNWEVLLILRFFQGIGAASLGSLNVTLIGDLFEEKKRGEVMGYNAGVLSTGTALYPAIGGALAMGGWQFPFVLPLIAIPAAFLVIFWLKNPEPKGKLNFKTYISNTWKLINRKQIWGLFTINILLFVVLYGALLSYFPQLMVERFQANTLHIGLLISGVSIFTALTASMKKQIDKVLHVKMQLNISFVLYLTSMLVLAFANEYWLLFIPLITFGIGNGMLIPGIQTLLVSSAPLNQRAGFMSINGMVLRIGQTFGPVIIGVFYTLGGLQTAYIGGAIATVLMLVVSFFMLKQV